MLLFVLKFGTILSDSYMIHAKAEEVLANCCFLADILAEDHGETGVVLGLANPASVSSGAVWHTPGLAQARPLDAMHLSSVSSGTVCCPL